MLTLHIGVGKTATTSLQNLFFAKHPSIHYLGTAHDMDECMRSFEAPIVELLTQDSLSWNPTPAKEAASTALEQTRSQDKIALYSNENILDGAQDKGLIMARLKECFGQCKILLTIREQRSFLCSLYGHDNNKLKGLPRPCNGRFLAMEDWLEHHHSLLTRQQGWFWLAQYDIMAQGLAQTFGRENVKILLFEQFCRDREAFLNELCAFLGIDAAPDLATLLGEKILNPGTADRWLQKHLYMQELTRKGSLLARHPKLLRLAGAIYSNRHRQPARVRIRMPEEWEEILYPLFRESNLRLVEGFGLPLEQYGYSL